MIFVKSLIASMLLFSSTNDHKDLMSAEDYYNSVSPSIFQDYDKATINIKEKIKYGDLPKMVPLLKNYKDRNLIMHLQTLRDDIPVDKIIYVFISIEMDPKYNMSKYIFIDSETNKPITKGSSWSKI